MVVRVGFLGNITANVDDAYANDSNYLMKHSGDNTGNLAFWFGFTRILDVNLTRVRWVDAPKKVREKIDVLVIAAANFLGPANDLSSLANLVAEVDKPVIISGLGAQSESESKIPVLKEGTIRFLNEVSKRCDSIHVRGEFSKLVCEHYGINNVHVLGCPSILMNPRQDLGLYVESKWTNPVMNFTTASASIKANLTKSEQWLYKQVLEQNGQYIIQRPAALAKLIRSEEVTEVELAYVEKFREYIDPSMSLEDMSDFFRKNGQVFSSAEAWLNSLRSYSHAICTRIHGTVFPISTGIPRICVTHDTRTRELANSMALASISAAEYGKNKLTVSELFEAVQFDGSGFDDNRRYLAKHYVEMFNSVDIPISAHLKQFL